MVVVGEERGDLLVVVGGSVTVTLIIEVDGVVLDGEMVDAEVVLNAETGTHQCSFLVQLNDV